MFDTMTLVKVGFGFLGAWLVLLLGKWAAEEVYHAEVHGDPSYVIEVASTEAEPEEEIDVMEMMLSAEAEKGKGVFRKCSACHKIDGTDAVGPHLNGVVGRDVASVGGFGYSGALTGLDGAWDEEALYGFLLNPKGYAPGTSMSFSGLKKMEDKVNVIAYLQSLQ